MFIWYTISIMKPEKKLSVLKDWVKARVMAEFEEFTYEGSDSKFHYFVINKNKVVGELSIEFNFRFSVKDGTLEINNKKGSWVYIDRFIY